MTWRTILSIAAWIVVGIVLWILLDSPRYRPFIGAGYMLLGLAILIRVRRENSVPKISRFADGIAVALIGASIMWDRSFLVFLASILFMGSYWAQQRSQRTGEPQSVALD